jgi:phosphohistidine phosphatase
VDLYVVRHAAAEPLGGEPADGKAGARTDAERALSAHGRERFAQAVRALDRIGVRLARVEHSPLLRAVQTAELLEPLLDGPCVANPALADAPTASLLGGLRTDATALVGHDPHVSALVALLCFGAASRGGGIRFSKGAVAWLTGEPKPGGMQLRALWPPKSLGALVGKER